MWRASSGQINKWRKKTLGLESTDLDHLHLRNVPFVYCFSEAVVPRPMGWPSSTFISGWWFLEAEETEYSPPETLAKFMKKARDDGKPLVYCGFGSITIPDPTALTLAVIEAVKTADVRMILAKGKLVSVM
jgi:sterol 3beta-glucosyltransferase